MQQQEKENFLIYLNALTSEYRKRLLKKLKANYKSNVRGKTKKYMKEHNIIFNECSMCGEKYYIEIHHIDYEKPYIVSPLCIKCHRKQHSKRKDNNIPVVDLEAMVKAYE